MQIQMPLSVPIPSPLGRAEQPSITCEGIPFRLLLQNEAAIGDAGLAAMIPSPVQVIDGLPLEQKPPSEEAPDPFAALMAVGQFLQMPIPMQAVQPTQPQAETTTVVPVNFPATPIQSGQMGIQTAPLPQPATQPELASLKMSAPIPAEAVLFPQAAKNPVDNSTAFVTRESTVQLHMNVPNPAEQTLYVDAHNSTYSEPSISETPTRQAEILYTSLAPKAELPQTSERSIRQASPANTLAEPIQAKPDEQAAPPAPSIQSLPRGDDSEFKLTSEQRKPMESTTQKALHSAELAHSPLSQVHSPQFVREPARAEDLYLAEQTVPIQMAEKLVSMKSTGKSTFQMQLFPEHLGQVTVKMAVKDGTLVIDISSPSLRTQQLLLSGADEIKSYLQVQYNQPAQVTVTTQQHWTQPDGQPSQHNPHQGQQQREREDSRANDPVDTSDFLSVMNEIRTALKSI